MHDYIRNYLGDTRDVKEFAKNYLDKRSQMMNATRKNVAQDDILAPAPAINPASENFQETKVRIRLQGLSLRFYLHSCMESVYNFLNITIVPIKYQMSI